MWENEFTANEMEVVVTVFHQYETGLRSGRINAEVRLCYGVVWCGVVCYGVVWCGVLWYAMVWCGVVWCAIV